jgi:hypothetical protein
VPALGGTEVLPSTRDNLTFGGTTEPVAGTRGTPADWLRDCVTDRPLFETYIELTEGLDNPKLPRAQ